MNQTGLCVRCLTRFTHNARMCGGCETLANEVRPLSPCTGIPPNPRFAVGDRDEMRIVRSPAFQRVNESAAQHEAAIPLFRSSDPSTK